MCVFAPACVPVPEHVGVYMRVRVCLALLIQHATRMRHIATSSVASLAPSYFSRVSHTRCDFRKKKLLYIKCVF